VVGQLVVDCSQWGRADDHLGNGEMLVGWEAEVSGGWEAAETTKSGRPGSEVAGLTYGNPRGVSGVESGPIGPFAIPPRERERS